MEIKEIAWLAGLIEGEGSFMINNTTPQITMQMTDRDVIERAAMIMRTKMRGPYLYSTSKKPTWVCSTYGSQAIAWMLTLLPFMGERRAEKIKEVVNWWKDYKPRPRPNKFAGTPYKRPRANAICHPDKPATGWGMCKVCYMRQWRAKRRAVTA